MAAYNYKEGKSWELSFEKLPKTLVEMQAMPQAALKSPADTAALAVAAFCLYPENKEEAKRMIAWLSGPRELTPMYWSFINDRFMDNVDYIPRSYFKGATPDNNYTPDQPYTLKLWDDPNSHADPNYCKVLLESGGADSPRQIQLRLKPSTGQYFLWEQFILVGIRQPKSMDPWA